jgi:hypothetical protein
MNEGSRHDGPRKWLLWGALLAGVSSIPFFILFFNFLRVLSPAKATGLAAVAGGLAEAYATFGLILTFALPVAAIVLLRQSFSRGNPTHKGWSLLFILGSAFLLLLTVWAQGPFSLNSAHDERSSIIVSKLLSL